MATSETPAKRPAGRKSTKQRPAKIKRTKRDKNIRAGAASVDVLRSDLLALIGEGANDNSSVTTPSTVPLQWSEVEVNIEALSATGDGLGRDAPDSQHLIIVPLTAPGDRVKAKIVSNQVEPIPYSKADLVEVLTPSPHRDDTLVKCRYFGKCAGCSFQMLPYPYQMGYKRNVVVNAYRHISGLSPEAVPQISPTMESPKQYGYRTKVTPHFDGISWARRKKGDGRRADEVPMIGFNQKQMSKTMDIEECPLATEACNRGLEAERARVSREIASYPRGATLLIRETTKRIPKDEYRLSTSPSPKAVIEDRGEFVHCKKAIVDPKQEFTEWIDDYQIRNIANSFFQNNSSILPRFVEYVRCHVQPGQPTPSSPGSPHHPNGNRQPGTLKNLIDAYSGSGLFSITLSGLFERTIGIDIDTAAIEQAMKNTSLNCKDELDTARQPKFIAADANELFASVQDFDPQETVVILDPPRKGCDENFLKQLLDFAPQRIVYVSCNVHTQASDIGWLLSDTNQPAGANCPSYTIESIQPFDFFPQTHHVESVAVLVRSGQETRLSAESSS